MAYFSRNHMLMVFLALSIIFFEFILRLATIGLGMADLSLLALFSLSFAAVIYLICSFFRGRHIWKIAAFFLFFVAFVYASQLIYYQIFRTFYSVYSASRASQVFEFWRDTLAVAGENLHWLGLLWLPFLLMVVVGSRLLTSYKGGWPDRTMVAGVLIAAQILGMTFVYYGDRGQNSAYHLYYEASHPDSSVACLGLFTTMRLDFQRTILGWSPVEAVTPPPIDDDPLPPPIPVEYNVLELDFQELFNQESDQLLKAMHSYFASIPATEKNEYTGMFAGYNLILITAEAFYPYAIRQDITPTLHKMYTQGFQFTNFYTPVWGVSTSDGEYVACTGLIPKKGIWSFHRSGTNYMPFVMGNQLNRLGYKSVAYHNHSYKYYRRNISHPNMGYVYKGVGNGLDVRRTWPASDLEMMEKTLPEYISHEPFHAYYMTVSGHLQYNFRGNFIAVKNRSLVQHLPYSQAVQAYLATQIELDRAMEYLLAKLEEAGVAERTLIAISSDHYPYGLKNTEINELAGYPVEEQFELHRNAFILYVPGMEPVTVDKYASSLDIIPTLSNLLGLEFDSRLLMGRDILSSAEPLVIFVDGSFIIQEGRYNAQTKKFIHHSGGTIDSDFLDEVLLQVQNRMYYSARILDTDYYRVILGK